ncbi:MAG: hypothetical protein NZZ41_08265, partial [Candidatus Dojkabacteria bacterium]|nr:hypothetical protein [Candidatus Dojkabacteria bacterium]
NILIPPNPFFDKNEKYINDEFFEKLKNELNKNIKYYVEINKNLKIKDIVILKKIINLVKPYIFNVDWEKNFVPKLLSYKFFDEYKKLKEIDIEDLARWTIEKSINYIKNKKIIGINYIPHKVNNTIILGERYKNLEIKILTQK